MKTIKSKSVDIKRITGANLSDEIKRDIVNGEMRIYAFWSISGNPFSFSNGYCMAFYWSSISPSIWLIGFHMKEIEISSI